MDKEFILNELHRFFEKRDLYDFVYLFGSFAKNKANSFSDIDIGVFYTDSDLDYLNTRLSEIKLELENVFKREVNTVMLNSAPPLLKHQIMKYGELIKCKDPVQLTNFKSQCLLEYMTYRRVMENMYSIRKNRIMERAKNG